MAVSFNVIPSNIRVPLFYAEVDNSMANTATAEKKALIVGQMTSDGSAPLGEARLISTVAQAKEKFGRGSPLALMVEAFRNQNSGGVLWCLPVGLGTITTPAKKAKCSITVSGTVSEGTLSVSVGEIVSEIAIAGTETTAEIASAIASTINGEDDAVVSASATDTTVALEALTAGADGNNIAVDITSFGDLTVSASEMTGGANASVVENGAKASGSITVAGAPTAAGTIALYIGGVKVPVSVNSTDTINTIASNIANAINGKADLPVTAQASNAVVTVTAKVNGVSGNSIGIKKNLQGSVGGEEDVAGITLTLTQMSNGAGEIDYTAAMANVETESYLFIGIQDNSSTALDAIKLDMNDSTGRWSYSRMQYGHVFTSKRGTSEALVNFGNTRNDQHVSVFGLETEFPAPDYVATGAILGRAATYFTNDPARPLQTGPLNGLMATPLKNRFGFNEQQALLSNGIATLYVQSGTVMIQREVTTYQRNSFGDPDNSYLDATTLYTLAEIISTLKTAITSKYARHKLANDGTRYGAGQAIVTPSVIRSELIAQYAALETKGLVENADLFAKYLIVERDVDDPNRVNVLLPPDLVNQLRVFALLAQFRLQYSAQD